MPRPRPRAAETAQPATPPRRRWAGLVLVAATVLAYGNSFQVPFLFDGRPTIRDNLQIRTLWPPWPLLLEPLPGSTVDGRPLVNLSYGVDYALWGGDVRGYHAVNLLIHLLAGLTLLGLVRRSLELPSLAGRYGRQAPGLALAVAALWTLHPIQTESVTYLNQRAESLAGLFVLLTVSCAARGMSSPRPGTWGLAAVVACLLGVATKETVVVAPLLVFLYDGVFVSPSFADALRRRWRLHLGLALTWVPLAMLAAGTHGRGGTAGLGSGVTVLDYALSQPVMLARYLWRVLWPPDLLFFYGAEPVREPLAIVATTLLFTLLALATLWALARRHPVGYLGAWLLATLAPTSSVVPIGTQIGAEHRVYLALAAPVALLVLGGYRLLERRPGPVRRRRAIAAVAVTALAGALAAATLDRNRDYATEATLWRDTVAKAPGLSAAWDQLGRALREEEGDPRAALAALDRAVELDPQSAEAHSERGQTLGVLGLRTRALADLDRALQLDPDNWLARYRRGLIRAVEGRYPEALADLDAVIAASDAPMAACQRGQVYERMGRDDDALAEYSRVIAARPAFEPAFRYRARLLLGRGDREGARRDLERLRELGVELDPGLERAAGR